MRFGRTRAGAFIGRHVSPRIDPWLYRKTRGRYPASLPVIASAPLMTTGAKTGQPRGPTRLLPRWERPDSDRLQLWGTKTPAVVLQPRGTPECQFGDERFVATVVSDPDEYVRLYALAEQVYAGYGDYRAKTVSIGRQIPIFRLKPY